MRRCYLLIVIVVWLAGLPGGDFRRLAAQEAASEAGGPVINDFTLREFADNGELAWQIYGKKAVVVGSRVRLTGVQMLCKNNGETYHIFTPSCEYDRNTQVGRGDQKVQMRSRNLIVDGVGFDLDLAARRLRIRQQVKMKVLGEDRNLLGNDHQ